jgi:cell division control protein 6
MNDESNILDAIKAEIASSTGCVYKSNGLMYLTEKYIPPNPKHRAEEIKQIGREIKKFVENGIPGSLLVCGNTGTGKTMSFKISEKLVNEILKDFSDTYSIIYVSAKGSKLSTVLSEIANSLNLCMPPRGISIKEYINAILSFSRNKYLHICIDEFDSLLYKDSKFEDVLYHFTRSENISVTIITNRLDLARDIEDSRVLSSLSLTNLVYFRSYTVEQCYDILKDRIELAFIDGFFSDDAIKVLASHIASEGGDIRRGLEILRLCGTLAEKHGWKTIDAERIKEIITKYELQKDLNILLQLSISEKLILCSIYTLILETRRDIVPSIDVYYLQDYFRKQLSIQPISQQTYWVYLTKLKTAGLINICKRGKGRGGGSDSELSLRISKSLIWDMIKKDSELSKVRAYINSCLKERRNTNGVQLSLF